MVKCVKCGKNHPSILELTKCLTDEPSNTIEVRLTSEELDFIITGLMCVTADYEDHGHKNMAKATRMLYQELQQIWKGEQ